MTEYAASVTLREKLIVAGMDELVQHGLERFSVRRIAASCGVSCAAPYKHFADRETFLAAIIEYINKKWTERVHLIEEKYAPDSRRQVVEVCIDFIRFLVETPRFRSILMLKTTKAYSIYGHLSRESNKIIRKYAGELGMPEETAKRKITVGRAIIYGAILMFDNGEMEYSEENLNMIEASIGLVIDQI